MSVVRAPPRKTKLPEHLHWLIRDACRQEITTMPELMTAANVNHYVLSWAYAFFATGDQEHAHGRLERVYRLRNAQPVPEGARVYDVPLSEPLKRCRSCGAGIYFTLTDAGKKVPVDVNQTSHFLSCPNASKHSKRKGTTT